MGAEQSFLSMEEEAPPLSSAAVRDAVTGQLGRGQLMDSHGSSLMHSGSQWRRQVEDLVNCDDAELCKPCAATAYP